MARKPEIQYIGQFYTYGSEAKQPELKPIPGKSAPAAKPVQQKKIKVYVDPVALAGIVVAVAMVIMMAVSTVQYVHAVEAYEAMVRARAHVRDDARNSEHGDHSNVGGTGGEGLDPSLG